MKGGACLESKRCENAGKKIVAMLATLKHRSDYGQISELTFQLLNYARFKDESGEEDSAKRVHAGLRKALKRLADDDAFFCDLLQLTEGPR
jgi:hypothetical protein